MTTKEVRNNFRIDLDKMSAGAYDTFLNEEIDYFASFAIRQFYARRMAGTTSDRTSFEQWQKRADDLKYVYAKAEISKTDSGMKNNSKWESFKIPDDYQHMLSEDVSVISTTGTSPEVIKEIGTFDVLECTTDNITERLNNTMSVHILYMNTMRPLRLYTFSPATIPDPEIIPTDPDITITDPTGKTDMFSVVYYIAPDDISIDKYTIEYIKKPNGFGMYSDGYNSETFSDTAKINQVPDYAWDEVLSIAIKHALENTSSNRIQTYAAEKVEIQ